MAEVSERDIEEVYSTGEFVAKLRRLADSLESGEKFEIQIEWPNGCSSRRRHDSASADRAFGLGS